jgi:trehalose 6-phosphate phosphatase
LSGGAVALVSGRLIRNLDALFAPLRLPAIGGHGAEMRLSSDHTIHVRHPTLIGAALRRLIDHIAHVDPRIIIEDKGYSIAVHYRLVPEIEHTLKIQIEAILEQVGIRDLEIMDGKAVFELKSANFSKGEAVCDMMNSRPFLHRTPVFIGDDTTDESVFHVLPKLGGLGYSVERPISGAVGTFDSPYEVRRWLARLCRSEGSVGE